jgi:3-methyladenine DNA glycosylase AlkD
VTDTLLSRLRAEMAFEADAERAPGMQAYMKSAMPFHGLKSDQVRSITRRVFADEQYTTCMQWQAAVLALWRHAKYREERYAAIGLASDKRFAHCRTPESLPMFEELITTGAWWDYVDEVAQLTGHMLRAYPKEMKPVMRAWSTDVNMWKRRVSIICQISFKHNTDLKLLYGNIKPNLGDRTFWIRKAIGWSLRAYAWTDPAEVARYVHEHELVLSGLSRREALKNVASDLR